LVERRPIAEQRCPHCSGASTQPLKDSEEAFGRHVVHQLPGAVENHDPVAAATRERQLAMRPSAEQITKD
jgi:hypothetical protein